MCLSIFSRQSCIFIQISKQKFVVDCRSSSKDQMRDPPTYAYQNDNDYLQPTQHEHIYSDARSRQCHQRGWSCHTYSGCHDTVPTKFHNFIRLLCRRQCHVRSGHLVMARQDRQRPAPFLSFCTCVGCRIKPFPQITGSWSSWPFPAVKFASYN